MANRWLNQFRYSFEKRLVNPILRAAIGASGAPTLDAANSKGIYSITRDVATAGKYTVQFGSAQNAVFVKDVYVKFMGLTFTSVFTSISTVGSVSVLADTTATDGKLVIQCVDYAGAAVDPASGEVIIVQFTFKDSTAP
jgi:hypothetical protein